MFFKGNCQSFKSWRRHARLFSQDILTINSFQRAIQKIKQIEGAFFKLKENTDKIQEIHLSSDGRNLQIILDQKQNVISFNVDSESGDILYKSPVSGFYYYFYDDLNGFYKSRRNEHFLDEILVRDQ